MLADGMDFFTDAKIAKEKQIPILVMFSAPDCSYCELVRTEVLDSMSELSEYKDKIIIRNISYSSGKNIKDFDNETISQAQFSIEYATDFYPTLIFMDYQGRVLATKVGVNLIDNYWTELDQIIEQTTIEIKKHEQYN